jgi:hypothetical protein
MHRFEDQPLGPTPTLVVLGSAKLGNYVVLQPLLRGLRSKYPAARLVYVGSRRTAELEALNPWIDEALPLAELAEEAIGPLRDWRTFLAGPVDLVINADGHSPHTVAWVEALAPRFVVGAAPLPAGEHPLQRLACDPSWADHDLASRYPGWIGSNSIRELHCRVAFVDTEFERVELPSLDPPADLPPLLLAVNGERPAKLWPTAHWLALLDRLGRELGQEPGRIGLLGAPPGARQGPGEASEAALLAAGVRDLRGRLSLPQLIGALAGSSLLVCIDSGPMHLAAAAGCPTLAIFGTDGAGLGASPRSLWAPRSPRLWCSVSPESCDGCLRLGYTNDACVVEGHPCQSAQDVDRIWPLLLEAWFSGGGVHPAAAR